MGQQTKGLLWLVLTILLGAGLAVGLPRLVLLLPWSVEERAGAVLMGSFGPSCAGNPEADALLQSMVQRLYPIYPDDTSFPVTVEVLPGPTVNAFAALGGHIYVYAGLLRQAESAEEVAGVLAHEMEHVRRRHVLQGVLVSLGTIEALKFLLTNGSSLGAAGARMFLHMGFSRQQEFEADEGGLKRLRDAHVDVGGFERFFERAKHESSFPAFLSDHPSNADRADLVRAFSGGSNTAIMNAKDFEKVKTMCR